MGKKKIHLLRFILKLSADGIIFYHSQSDQFKIMRNDEGDLSKCDIKVLSTVIADW